MLVVDSESSSRDDILEAEEVRLLHRLPQVKGVRTGLDLESRLSRGLEDGDEEGVRRSGLQRNYTTSHRNLTLNNLKEAQRAKPTAVRVPVPWMTSGCCALSLCSPSRADSASLSSTGRGSGGRGFSGVPLFCGRRAAFRYGWRSAAGQTAGGDRTLDLTHLTPDSSPYRHLLHPHHRWLIPTPDHDPA